MSSALAAAKKRRAFGEPTNKIVTPKQSSPPPTPTQSQIPQNDKPMTINQAFKNMSDRINVLEGKVTENTGVPEVSIKEF